MTTSHSRLDVWRIEIDELEGLDLLTGEETKRAERYLLEAKQREYTVARSAMRRILSLYVEVPESEIEFQTGEHGRPELPGVAWNFNLSHSDGMALLGVGQRDLLGVDVERRREGRPFGRLARRFFSVAEARSFQRLAEESEETVFYRGWTRKEAYLKAWGTGLTFSSRGFSLTLEPQDALLVETQMPGDDGRGWHFRDLDVGSLHAACVCWRGADADVRLLGFRPERAREDFGNLAEVGGPE